MEPIFEENCFVDQNEENFEEDFDKKSLYKIDIFQICMKYFSDLSLFSRGI